MSKKTGQIWIGTSGWHYQHWKGPFYPKDLSNSRLLEYYLKYFDTSEINNTFYQLPDEKTFAVWGKSVPESFIFAVKASRYITHMKKLKDPEEPLNRFFTAVKNLKGNLGPLLFQLPPRWEKNLDRLSDFLTSLPGGRRYAFEFRDESWFGAEIEKMLSEHEAAFCIYDFEKRESPHFVTADYIYVRLHGPQGAYRGKYGDDTLSRWANEFSQWQSEGRDIYCYFDNDENGYAVTNALRLKEMVAGK